MPCTKIHSTVRHETVKLHEKHLRVIDIVFPSDRVDMTPKEELMKAKIAKN